MVVARGIAVALLCAPTILAQSNQRAADSARSIAFDRLDRTAQTLLATINCARRGGYARATGVLGPTDSVGRLGYCVFIGGKPFAAYFTTDSTFRRAQNLRVVDVQKLVRYVQPVDTAAILTAVRAGGQAVRKGHPSFERARRPYAPLTIRSDGDSIEVWLIAAGSVMGRDSVAVGGELGYIFSPDGRTLVREINAFDRYRTIPIPDSGQVNIFSKEDDLPLLSELIVANLFHGEGREVQIVTAAYVSHLTARGPNSVWIQMRKR